MNIITKDVGGSYRIYQGKNGAIYLHIGSQVTILTSEQINDLLIESKFYDIPDFSPEDYTNYYALTHS